MPFKRVPVISLALFLLALVAWACFLHEPFFGPYTGWMFREVVANPREWQYGGFSGIDSLITTTLLVLASPFLGSVCSRSRLAWGLCLCVAGLATVAFLPWIVHALRFPPTPFDRSLVVAMVGFQYGIWFVFTAAFLNFAGLLFARWGRSAESASAARIAAVFPPVPSESGGIPGETPDSDPQSTENR